VRGVGRGARFYLNCEVPIVKFSRDSVKGLHLTGSVWGTQGGEEKGLGVRLRLLSRPSKL